MEGFGYLGIFEEGANYKMVAGIARPQNAATSNAFKSLQTRINDVLWLHGRSGEKIAVDGLIGSGTRAAMLSVARYVGGSTYMDMFVQAPSERLLARYAVEITNDLNGALHGASEPGTTTVLNMPPDYINRTPGAPPGPLNPPPGDTMAWLSANGPKVGAVFGLGYLLMKDKKGKRKYTRKRKPTKRKPAKRKRSRRR